MQQLCLIILQLFLLSWTPWVRGQEVCSSIMQPLSVWYSTRWGDWGYTERCPTGTYASGFSIKVERHQGSGDDTAVNGIRLYCVDPNNRNRYVRTIESSVGRWGDWTPVKWCTLGYLSAFMLRVERHQGDGDDTSVNNIKFMCSYTNFQLEGDGMNWGSWGSWSCKCQKGICGIQTRVEGPQGSGDDTALNDVQFTCCS